LIPDLDEQNSGSYIFEFILRNGADVYALIESPEKCLSNTGVFMSNGAEMEEKRYILCLQYNVTSRSQRPPVMESAKLQSVAVLFGRKTLPQVVGDGMKELSS
jgi:hypothetical protein